jgi:hypothetical protein
MYIDLFGKICDKEEVIRTLGFYQPFASLMLPPGNKIETRWVIKHRRPPFPLGKYLFYSTKKSCDHETLLEWCGSEAVVKNIHRILQENPTHYPLNGYAIGVGILDEVRLMNESDEEMAYVEWRGDRKVKGVTRVQWVLKFKGVKPINPFVWKHGSQGAGIMPKELIKKIELI